MVPGSSNFKFNYQSLSESSHYTTDELQARLFNAFSVDESDPSMLPRSRKAVESRYSLRGVSFIQRGKGTDQDLFLGRETISIMKLLSKTYGIPLEVLILGLLMVAEARCSKQEYLNYTLYVPQRDKD